VRLVIVVDSTFYPALENNWRYKIFSQRVVDRLASETVVLDIYADTDLFQELPFPKQVARLGFQMAAIN